MCVCTLSQPLSNIFTHVFWFTNKHKTNTKQFKQRHRQNIFFKQTVRHKIMATDNKTLRKTINIDYIFKIFQLILPISRQTKISLQKGGSIKQFAQDYKS